jgi:hypothetical protein
MFVFVDLLGWDLASDNPAKETIRIAHHTSSRKTIAFR